MLSKENFKNLLLSNWTTFIDSKKLIKKVIEDANSENYREIIDKNLQVPPMKLTITDFSEDFNINFEIWIEFSCPKKEGYVIGTHIYELDFKNQNLILKKTFGIYYSS